MNVSLSLDKSTMIRDAGYEGAPSDPVRIQGFIDILERGGIPATIRVRRGIDIDAGCGQLKSKKVADSL